MKYLKKSVLLQPQKDRGVAQLASALAWGARGRKFESSHPDHKKRDVFASLFLCLFQRKYQRYWIVVGNIRYSVIHSYRLINQIISIL